MSELDFLRELLIKFNDDVKRLNGQIERLQVQTNANRIEDVKEREQIKETLKALQSRVDTLMKIFGDHKKKGIIAILGAVLIGGAIAKGSLNYEEIIKSFFGIVK